VLELLAKRSKSTGEAGLHGTDRDAEEIGRLLLRAILGMPEHDNGALLRWQRPDGLPQLILGIDAILEAAVRRLHSGRAPIDPPSRHFTTLEPDSAQPPVGEVGGTAPQIGRQVVDLAAPVVRPRSGVGLGEQVVSTRAAADDEVGEATQIGLVACPSCANVSDRSCVSENAGATRIVCMSLRTRFMTNAFHSCGKCFAPSRPCRRSAAVTLAKRPF